ncbi:MAG TPA: pantoate--beta-alanine ligase [Candidatus Didemnitutus sp.]
MLTIETIEEMRAAAARLRANGARVALIPTMGALNLGHASLIRHAKSKGYAVVLSTFVNPLQFGPNEDLAKYPRAPAADVALAEREEVDVLLVPTAEEMYPKGFSTYVSEDRVSKPLCGLSRPTLFRGVLTCWLKLINVVQPDVLVMGDRDLQQVAVLRKALQDLMVPVEILTVGTVRDVDGLAVSARNAYLSPTHRADALAVYQSLCKAKEMVESGVKSADRVVAEMTHILSEKRRLRIIHIAIVNRESMETMREIVPDQSLLMIAYWVDEVRLTDNLAL